MKKMKIIIYSLFLCLIALLFTGCSTYNELNTIMIVDGIAIDKIEDEYIIYFNTYVKDDEYEVHEIREKDLNDAFNTIYLEANKNIYLSHLNTLFLSSNLENEDMIDVVNTFNKRSDLRGTFNVIMIHHFTSGLFDNPSQRIIELLKNNHSELGTIYPTTFNDLITDYQELQIAYIPILDENLKVIGMHSLFDEYRFYNDNEALILNILQDKTENTAFTIDSDEVKIKNIDICYETKENELLMTLDLLYQGNTSKKEIANYLKNNIDHFLSLDINQNYFFNVIKKKNYSFYQNHPHFTIQFDIVINLSKDEINNMKDGDLIEKN